MNYNDFCKKLGFDRSKPTEIGRLFDVSPQVVHNWKMRNSVPANIVLKAMEKNLITSESLVNNPAA